MLNLSHERLKGYVLKPSLFNLFYLGEDNKFLREEIVYSSKGYYYFAILEDFVLRLGWVVSLSLSEFTGVDATIVSSVLAPLEIFRRFVWNFFRLENEHLNNCGKTP